MPNGAFKISSFTRTEICTLFKKAKMRVRLRGIRILTAPTQGELGRILIVTPKKSGSAPERNLFKRRVRALFREKKLFNKKIDFVIITSKQGINIKFKILACLIERALQMHK